ncbi:MAG: hypothetical protein FJ217_01955 [Ignavibacteria bacterium]|nr:hypothetical protein [Ignavibacteria bacterium]
MKNSPFGSILLLLFLVTANLYGQDPSSPRGVFPVGITAEYGVGKYSVRDEYISKEKYSGTLPYFNLTWSKFHDTYGYFLAAEFQTSNKVKNYNVSAEVYQFSLHQGFLYPLAQASLLTKDLHLFLGPSTELFFFYNKQDIAVSGFDYAQSFAMLISLGAQSEVIVPISSGLQAEASLGLSLLSLGFRMVDMEEEDVSPAKLLTVLSGTNGSIRLGVRYYVFDNLSAKLSYRLQVTRISSWDPLLSAGDNLHVSLTYGF